MTRECQSAVCRNVTVDVLAAEVDRLALVGASRSGGYGQHGNHCNHDGTGLGPQRGRPEVRIRDMAP